MLITDDRTSTVTMLEGSLGAGAPPSEPATPTVASTFCFCFCTTPPPAVGGAEAGAHTCD
jgi:hypothetical protein